ncbi:MAG: MFS transporter [Clostridia bacterium]|nr:MFS transporter [Clostridia bacterium]
MENTKSKALNKITSLVSTAKEQWNTPAKGNYMPYKEVLSFAAAGYGAQWTTLLCSSIGLDAANFFTGASLGIQPLHLQYMLILANIIGMPIGIWRAWYIDNHNMKGGKFLPFIIRTAFPIVFLSMILVWLPFEIWSYNTKIVVVWCFYLVMQIFLCFYNEAYQTLYYVISPNSQERANVMSIIQIIYSFAPTLTGLFIPILATFTGGLNNIQTYRIVYPAFTVVGLIINTIFFRKVKERIVAPKKKLEHIRIIDAIREVSKNKYYWILSSSSWVGFLEGAYGVILSWSFVYSSSNVKDQMGLGVANTIIGNAALWAMLAAPFLIRFLGKRNLLILCNMLNVVMLLFLYQVYENIILIVVFWYINNFINVVNNNLNIPLINADMRDYHQWKTGVRIDGLFGPLGLIGTFLGFFTGLIIPAVYEKMGLKDDYNVLYDDTIRYNLFEVLIILSIIGAILNLIPYLFYDLTEDKHKGYVRVLKIRAMFEDYGNGVLEDELLADGMETIHRAQECFGKERITPDKSALKAAKKLPHKTDEEKAVREEEIRKAKELIKEQKQFNQDVFTSSFVLDEINKFSTERYKASVLAAEKTFAEGKFFIWENLAEEKKQAKALPKSTKEEKEIRSDALALIRKKKDSLKILRKLGAENLTEPDEKVKEEIQNRETTSLRASLQARKELRKWMKDESFYLRAVAPYVQAEKLLAQKENYTCLDALEEKYSCLMNK